jgi:coenzyme F420 hydrogenase subunit beta
MGALAQTGKFVEAILRGVQESQDGNENSDHGRGSERQSEKRYKGAAKKMELKPCKELETKVIQENLCTLCGACTEMCPYLVAYKGRIVLRDNCNLSQGRCHEFCPRISLDLDKVHRAVFGAGYEWDSLGQVREVLLARSADKDVKSKAQYGGVVTAIMALALAEGLIEEAVLTRLEHKGLPEGTLATTKKEILSCAGSSYIAAPTIGVFNRATGMNDRKQIGVVGTPCQVLALANMRAAPSAMQDNVKTLSLTIGLFCTWALSSEEFVRFLEAKVPLSKIKKVDIPPPPADVFEIYTASGRISVPLDEIRKFIRPACTYCTDLTAEFADISVGAAEGIEGWNTVLVRSERGAELFRKAKSEKSLEIDTMPARNLEHLKEAALLKKKRGLKNIIQRTENADDLLYLKANAKTVKEFLNG